VAIPIGDPFRKAVKQRHESSRVNNPQIAAQFSVVTAGSDLQEPVYRPSVMLTGFRFSELVDASDLRSAEPDWHRLPSVVVTP
jgi:hypothetical protein